MAKRRSASPVGRAGRLRSAGSRHDLAYFSTCSDPPSMNFPSAAASSASRSAAASMTRSTRLNEPMISFFTAKACFGREAWRMAIADLGSGGTNSRGMARRRCDACGRSWSVTWRWRSRAASGTPGEGARRLWHRHEIAMAEHVPLPLRRECRRNGRRSDFTHPRPDQRA
jgi:hypothetical protein